MAEADIRQDGNTFHKNTITLSHNEVAALQALFNSGGNLAQHVEHLRWEVRTYNVAGTYGKAENAEQELRHLHAAISSLTIHKFR